MIKHLCYISILTGLLFFSCTKAEKRQLEKDIEEIEEYLEDNNLTAECTASGLRYIIDEQGNGEAPTLSSSVTVAYRGFYPSGATFEESPSDGITFQLGGVIEGWQEGIQLFNEGGSGTLYIPSGLAYGPQGNSSIGGDAVIFFDIELLEVN